MYGSMNRARITPVVASYKQNTIVAGGSGCTRGDIVLDSSEVLNTSTNQLTSSTTCLPQQIWGTNGTTCNSSLVITGYYG